MPSLATRRLVDAAAALDPADRALLNLWVNRGLGDEQLLRFTRLSPEALGARRERIIERLGEILGLPEPDVAAALADLATAGGEATAEPVPASVAPASEPPASQPPVSPAEPDAAAPPPRPRRRLLAATALLALIVAAIVVVLTSGGGAAASRSAPPAASHAASPATSGPAAHAVALVPLPGGPASAGGEAQITRQGATLILHLNLRLLSAPPAGEHYEVWLYNSVIDSRPLVSFAGSKGSVSIRLPADAARYSWLDVSLQGAGSAGHSGDSVLRAANPVRTSG